MQSLSQMFDRAGGGYGCQSTNCNENDVSGSLSKVTLTLSLPEMKIAEFPNSIDLDEMAHNEPPHLDLHCLPSSL